MVYNMGIKQKRRWSNLHEAIAKRGTLTRGELKGLTFERVSPDDLMYGCGFLQQNRLEDSQRYIDLHYQYLESGTPEEKVQKVYTKLKDYLERTAVTSQQLSRELAGLDKFWPQMQETLRRQAGLTEIFLDYGCESRFVYPYIARGANAMTLAIAYGMAYDIAGDFRWVPLTDMACFHIIWEAICVGIRRRGAVEVDKALAIDARMSEPWDLALLGGGVLAPWRLQKGVPFEKLAKQCRIHAVDMDQRCVDWLPLVFGKEYVQKIDAKHAIIPKYNIAYSVASIAEFCMASENQQRYMAAHMMGVLSYCNKDQKQALLGGASRTIRDKGYILADLQLQTTQSKRNSVAFWLNDSLNQEPDFDTAYRIMCEMGDKLDLVCTVADYGNELEEPSTATFCLTKRNVIVAVA